MRKKKIPATFSLSFLDIMFCGFGAVILLVLVINANTISFRKKVHTDLRADVVRLEIEVKTGREHLVQVHNSLRVQEEEISQTRGKSDEIIAQIVKIREELADMQHQTLARKEHIKSLKADLVNLEQENMRLGSELQAKKDMGPKVRRFEGEGNRQYLTGLKLGGKRVLLLIDSSASMLDETIVNVIRRKNMDEKTKQKSPKWQRAIRTAEWLIANLPPDSTMQAFTFNTKAASLNPDNPGAWIKPTDSMAVNEIVKNLHRTVPTGGTSLENTFALAKQLLPQPDNILLITDGLPTQGANISRRTTVSGDQRLKHFEKAAGILPRRIPVNTILFPMEGDPMAAVMFWRLAVNSRGSFFTPTLDWP